MNLSKGVSTIPEPSKDQDSLWPVPLFSLKISTFVPTISHETGSCPLTSLAVVKMKEPAADGPDEAVISKPLFLRPKFRYLVKDDASKRSSGPQSPGTPLSGEAW